MNFKARINLKADMNFKAGMNDIHSAGTHFQGEYGSFIYYPPGLKESFSIYKDFDLKNSLHWR